MKALKGFFLRCFILQRVPIIQKGADIRPLNKHRLEMWHDGQFHAML